MCTRQDFFLVSPLSLPSGYAQTHAHTHTHTHIQTNTHTPSITHTHTLHTQLEHHASRLRSEINEMAEAFDDALGQLRREKFMLEAQIKTCEIRQLVHAQVRRDCSASTRSGPLELMLLHAET